MLTAPKDPAKVRAGKAGSRARWGEPRRVRLDALSEPVRLAVVALIEADTQARAAMQSEAPTVDETAVGAELEGHRASDDRPAA